jgi:hypothetical protein
VPAAAPVVLKCFTRRAEAQSSARKHPFSEPAFKYLHQQPIKRTNLMRSGFNRLLDVPRIIHTRLDEIMVIATVGLFTYVAFTEPLTPRLTLALAGLAYCTFEIICFAPAESGV